MTEPLPKTASPLPLIAAVGLLVLGSAVGLGLLRQRATGSLSCT
jgi:LPXTG-motif cell wall-anchored protein